jgi:hypothetical protein
LLGIDEGEPRPGFRADGTVAPDRAFRQIQIADWYKDSRS